MSVIQVKARNCASILSDGSDDEVIRRKNRRINKLLGNNESMCRCSQDLDLELFSSSLSSSFNSNASLDPSYSTPISSCSASYSPSPIRRRGSSRRRVMTSTFFVFCILITMLPSATSLSNLLVAPPIPTSSFPSQRCSYPSRYQATHTITSRMTKPVYQKHMTGTSQSQIGITASSLTMSPKYVELFTGPDETNDDTSSRWLAWMTGGHISPRKTDEVKMREAEELGGVPRAERYASRDWLHNTINMPNSRILRSVRFPVLFMTTWGFSISFLHKALLNRGKVEMAARLCIPTAPLSMMVSALGLLLVFRTNSAYQRFSEGRKIWEDILSTARDLSRLVKLYEGEIGSAKLRRLNRLLAAFPYLLRFRIRPNSIMKKIDDPDVKRDPESSLILYQDHGE